MYYVGDYGVKHYRADSYSDLANIDVSSAKMGSTVFVIDTSTYYMLNGNKQWVLVNLASGGGGGGTDEPKHIIYEGGGV